jgi:hypothetical protein
LKIAQIIDRENRMKKAWNQEDEEDEDDEDDVKVYTVDDMGDEENPRKIDKKEYDDAYD